MTEAYIAPEQGVLASEFVTTVIATGGDVNAIHNQYPQLTTVFIGEHTLKADMPQSEDTPIPYGTLFTPNVVPVGDVVRARGTFHVKRTDGGYQLTFEPGSQDSHFHLQEIDQATADAFVAYGATYTEVDLTFTRLDASGVDNRATLESIVGVQEQLVAPREYTLGEIVQIDGIVVEYSSGCPDDTPKLGSIALMDRRSASRDVSRQESRIVVRTANGYLVSLEPGYRGDIYYRDEAELDLPAPVMVGDRIRVVAEYTYVSMHKQDLGCRLEPRVLQLHGASEERAMRIEQWREAIQAHIDVLATTGTANVPAELSELLATTLYREQGHSLRLNITRVQKENIVTRLEAAYADDAENMPVIIEALKQPSNDILESAAYAMTEGLPAFSMTSQEMIAAVENRIANRPEYNGPEHNSPNLSITYTIRLFERLFPADIRMSVLQRAWDRIKNSEGSQDAISARVTAVCELALGLHTTESAALLSEMAQWDKLEFADAGHLLTKGLVALGAQKDEPGRVEFEMLGTYHDAILTLQDRRKAMPDKQRDYAYLDLGSAEHAFEQRATHYYATARKLGMLP